MDEFNTNTLQGIFSANTPAPISYGNPTRLQEFSFDGTTEYSDAYELVTGSLTNATPAIFLSPSSGHVSTSVTISGSGLVASANLAVTYDDSSAGMPTTCTTDASGNTNSGCTFTVPFSSVLGPHTITASDGTNSPTATFTATLLGVRCSRSTVVAGSATTCKATVHESGTKAPTGNLTWSSSSSGTFSSATCKLSHAKHASYSTCSVKFTPAAADSSVILMANYGGDLKNPATVGAYDLIATMEAAKTTVSCSPRTGVAGSWTIITCTAKVKGYSPTGTVTWTQSSTGSVSFVATTCTLSKVSLSVSSCSVTMTGAQSGNVVVQASFGGDPNNAPSSGTHRLAVGKALPTVAIACSSPLSVGMPVICTATVSGYSPTGTVTWTRISGAGRVTFSSKTCTLSSGSCQVTVTATKAGSVKVKAAYGGDSNNFRSAGTLVLTITS